jgi:tetratricopeptide (TPR) repeat protein
MRTQQIIVTLASLLVLTAAVYAPGLHGEFAFDDLHTVQLNRNIHDVERYLQQASLQNIMRGSRVLTDITFGLDYQIAGNDPFPFHATNLVIHLCVTLLVFFYTRRMFSLSGLASADFLALAVAAFFALHPLQTQAVAYISQRAESLASAFYLASLLLLGSAERRGRCMAGVALYLGAFALFALGLAAKVIVVTLPAAYLSTGLLAGSDQRLALARLRRRLALIAPFILLILYATLSAALTGPGLLKGEDAGLGIPSLAPGRYFITQWHVIATYLRLLFWPAGQNLDWDFPLANGIGDPVVLACGLLLVTLLVVAASLFIRFRARNDSVGASSRAVTFGIVWFFLILAPTSSVIPLADVLMEHRLYLASWGMFFAVVALAAAVTEYMARPLRSRLALISLLGLCAFLGIGTYFRARVWSSGLLLWTDVVAKSPNKARAHLGLGSAYRLSGRAQQAIDECETALRLATNGPAWIRVNIRGEMASALFSQSRTGEAIAVAEAGLAESPNESGLLGVVAMAHLRRNEMPEAEAAAERYLHASPQPAAALRVLGFVRMRRQNYPGGIEAFEHALQLEPNELQGCMLLAEAYRTVGRNQDACDILRSVREPNAEQQEQLKQALIGCPPL